MIKCYNCGKEFVTAEDIVFSDLSIIIEGAPLYSAEKYIRLFCSIKCYDAKHPRDASK